MKSRAVKQQDLEALQTEFRSAESAFLVEFRGLKVTDVDELRRQVREKSGSYRVVKNTLARSASKGTEIERVAEYFNGPTAVVTTGEDVASVAKVLSEFAKTNPAVRMKAGVVSGTALDEAGCKEVADIPSREELQSRLAYLLQSPLRGLATVLNAPSRDLAVVLGQVASQREGDAAEA